MFTIKKYFYLATILCFLTTSFSLHYLWAEEALRKTPSDHQKAEGKQEKASTQNNPRITLDYIQYDVGEVYEGDKIVHAFTIKNAGTAQLNIKKVKAG